MDGRPPPAGGWRTGTTHSVRGPSSGTCGHVFLEQRRGRRRICRIVALNTSFNVLLIITIIIFTLPPWGRKEPKTDVVPAGRSQHARFGAASRVTLLESEPCPRPTWGRRESTPRPRGDPELLGVGSSHQSGFQGPDYPARPRPPVPCCPSHKCAPTCQPVRLRCVPGKHVTAP